MIRSRKHIAYIVAVLSIAMIIGILVEAQPTKDTLPENWDPFPEQVFVESEQVTAIHLTKKEAFALLQKHQGQLSALDPQTKRGIAMAYGIVEEETGSTTDITLRLETEETSVNMLHFEQDQEFFEIGACSTNKRMYIENKTGEEKPIHEHVYCGGYY